MKRSLACLMFVAVVLMSPLISAQEEPAAGPFTEVETAICAAVEEREPVGEAASFAPDVGQVCLWTKLTGAVDSTSVTHVWYYNGEEMASVELPVKSSMWRTWSSKKILPSWVGEWEVKVVDSQGNILKSVSFKIEKTTAEEQAPEAPTDVTAEPTSDST